MRTWLDVDRRLQLCLPAASFFERGLALTASELLKHRNYAQNPTLRLKARNCLLSSSVRKSWEVLGRLKLKTRLVVYLEGAFSRGSPDTVGESPATRVSSPFCAGLEPLPLPIRQSSRRDARNEAFQPVLALDHFAIGPCHLAIPGCLRRI